jgi:hypothetical protein
MSGNKRVDAGKFAEASDLAEVTQAPEYGMSIYLRFLRMGKVGTQCSKDHAESSWRECLADLPAGLVNPLRRGRLDSAQAPRLDVDHSKTVTSHTRDGGAQCDGDMARAPIDL